MPANEDKPGPSGYRRKEDEKNKKDRDKRAVRIAENHARTARKRRQHLRIEYDVPSRYKLPTRGRGAQPSHTVRRFLASPPPTPRTTERRTRLVVHVPEPVRRSHHHLDAVDYYYRSTAYGTRHKDDIGNLRMKNAHQRDRVKPKKPAHRPRQTCRNCLEPISSCICILGIERPPKSDWTVILSHRPERPLGFHKSRIAWLEKLEQQSKKIDVEKLAIKKFDIHNEICCFPFTTFWFFFKRDMECFDYYRKENNKKNK